MTLKGSVSRGGADPFAFPAARLALISALLVLLTHADVAAMTPPGGVLSWRFLTLSAVLTAGPYAVLGVGLLRRQTPFVLALTRALARLAGVIVGVVIIGGLFVNLLTPLFLIVPALGLIGMSLLIPTRDLLANIGIVGVGLLILFVFAQRMLAAAATEAMAGPPNVMSQRIGLLMAGAYLAAVLPLGARHRNASQTAALENALAIASRMRQDPVTARRALMAIQKCLEIHAGSDTAGYPRSLAPLGSRGDGCLSDTVATGKPNGWTVVYAPGTQDGARAIHSYRVLIAPPPDFPGGTDAVAGDESGAIYSGRIAANASAPVPALLTDSPAQRMRALATCLPQLRAEFKADGFPEVIGPKAPYPAWGCLASYGGPGWRKSRLREHFGDVSAYDILYLPGAKDSAGLITGFTIEARPVSYGTTGLRSFLLDEDGVIHSTPRDRRATPSDPAIRDCELRPGVNCTY
jgi:hypothetical protein